MSQVKLAVVVVLSGKPADAVFRARRDHEETVMGLKLAGVRDIRARELLSVYQASCMKILTYTGVVRTRGPNLALHQIDPTHLAVKLKTITADIDVDWHGLSN